MYPEQALKHIEKGRISPVYVLFGGEYYYVQAVVAALRTQVLRDSDPSMCLSEYDGTEVTPAQVLDDLRTMTFFGGLRLVIVEHADRFIRDNKDVLGRYAKAPSKTGCLVLICAEKPDKRYMLVKTADEAGGLIECTTPRAGRLAQWVRNRAAELGKPASRSAAELLIEIVGQDLAQIDSHLQMLVTYVGDRPGISEQDVAATVDEDKTVQIWDLMDGIASKNSKQALEAFDRLLPRAGMEVARLSLIGSTLLRLRMVKKVMEQYGDESSVARVLKMHPYFAKKSIEHSRRFTTEELAVGIHKAFEADLLIKSNRMKPRLAVEKLIVELCK